MLSNPSGPGAGSKKSPAVMGAVPPLLWAALALSLGIVWWFYGMDGRYGPARTLTAFNWVFVSWNRETDYEHGVLVPFVIVGLIIYRFKDLRAAAGEGSKWGLAVAVFGCFLFLIGSRTIQPRITLGALPFIVWGSAFSLWGWRVAKMLLFPIFFFWLAIPLPSFQQATVGLQKLATLLAHYGSALCGVQTYVVGTKVLPIKGDWQPLDIAAGCSGIRSLMALLMISAAWAYVAKISLWKKVLLFFCAFPLAILGNALRVTSIFVIAEYGDARWATTTWHDWSGLLLFYPFSLMLLLAVHSLLEGGLPWKKGPKRQVRRVVVSHSVEPKSFLSES